MNILFLEIIMIVMLVEVVSKISFYIGFVFEEVLLVFLFGIS